MYYVVAEIQDVINVYLFFYPTRDLSKLICILHGRVVCI
jgi:hypothetical protein